MGARSHETGVGSTCPARWTSVLACTGEGGKSGWANLVLRAARYDLVQGSFFDAGRLGKWVLSVLGDAHGDQEWAAPYSDSGFESEWRPAQQVHG